MLNVGSVLHQVSSAEAGKATMAATKTATTIGVA
jgi:hypothetical protein